jgi:hypothetical protein
MKRSTLHKEMKKLDISWLDNCPLGSSCATWLARAWCCFLSVPLAVSARQIRKSRLRLLYAAKPRTCHRRYSPCFNSVSGRFLSLGKPLRR